MIVITSLNRKETYLCAGDIFSLTVEDVTGCQVLIREEITVTRIINFVASYRFALEDGTCPGFHLCGIFGKKDELPLEFMEAKMLDDLTPTQYENFVNSVGVKIDRPSRGVPSWFTGAAERLFSVKPGKGKK